MFHFNMYYLTEIGRRGTKSPQATYNPFELGQRSNSTLYKSPKEHKITRYL